MASKDTSRGNVGDAVFSTSNLPSPLPSSSSVSQVTSSQHSSTSPSSRSSFLTSPSSVSTPSVAFTFPLSCSSSTSSNALPSPPAINTVINNIPPAFDNIDLLKTILDTARSVQPAKPDDISPSGLTVSPPVDLAGVSLRLSELLTQEEAISAQKQDLETKLAELRTKENELFQQRSRLIKQLEKLLSPQCNISSKALSSPTQRNSFTSKTKSTTIIEKLGPDPVQPRSLEHRTPSSSLTSKRPGPASKTGLLGTKQINPGALPPLGPTSSGAKKSRIDGGDTNKRPVTTGVKQSRPQPMRARKRNKPIDGLNEELRSGSTSQNQVASDQQSQPLTQSQAQQTQQIQQQQQQQQQSFKQSPSQKTQSHVNTIKDPKPSQDRENSKAQSPSRSRVDNSGSTPHKEKKPMLETPKIKIKQEPGMKEAKETKPDIKVSNAKNDNNEGPLESQPNLHEDSHSDSDIFEALGIFSDEEQSDNGNKGIKIKQESNVPVIKQVDAQEAARFEAKIKKEKMI